MKIFNRFRGQENEPEQNFLPGRPIIATGTGRCGTHFLYELLNAHKHVNAFHIQHLDADSFYRYCAWNNLPVDTADFIAYRQKYIEDATTQRKLYFESNPYLSFSINLLYSHLKTKYIFIIRNPEAVVRSHIVKGWYSKDPLVKDPNKAIGFQYKMKTNHFLGRIVPSGTEYERWSNLTRVGKLAWMWNEVNMKIQEELDKLPKEHFFFIKVEDLDHHRFMNILSFMELPQDIDESKFKAIKNAKPGKGVKKEVSEWTNREWDEFYQETRRGREIFGY